MNVTGWRRKKKLRDGAVCFSRIAVEYYACAVFFLSFQLVPILAESLLAPLTIPFGLCVLSNVRRDKVQIERMSAMREILLAS